MIPYLTTSRRSARAYAKYALRKKTFTSRVLCEQGNVVSARTQFVFNAQTGVCNPSCAIWAHGRAIYPTKQRLRDAMPTITGAIQHYHDKNREWLRIQLPKKYNAWAHFPKGADVIVTLRDHPNVNMVSAVHTMGIFKFVPITQNASHEFAYGAHVIITLAQTGSTHIIQFRGKYTKGNAIGISLQYADIYDEKGEHLGAMSAQAATVPNSWDNVWTGDIEVCFGPVNSDELLLVAVMPSGISPSDKRRNIWKAKACIRQCYVAAKKLA